MPGKKDKKKSKGKNAEVGVAGVDDALRNMSQTTISATDNPLGGKLPAVGEGIGYDEREAKAARNTRHAAHGTLRYSTAESHARFAAPPLPRKCGLDLHRSAFSGVRSSTQECTPP